MTSFYIYPFRYECDNAIMLRNRLKGQRIKLQDSQYKYKKGDVIVNWGNSKCPSYPTIVNHPRSVGFAVDKLVAFDILRNSHLPTVSITRNRAVAQMWLEQNFLVLGRSKIKGNNGQGIEFFDGKNCPNAKFYTKYLQDCNEYRVNVYKNEIISVRVKERDPKLPKEDNPIRSGNNGYFFKPAKTVQEPVVEVAKEAIAALGLDFGGVDVLETINNVYILEINTAPELQGPAMDKLAEFIKKDYGN